MPQTGSSGGRTNHVPYVVGGPVQDGLHSTDKLQVFGFTDTFLDEKQHETSGNEWHGKDNAYGHQDIYWGGHPVEVTEKTVSRNITPKTCKHTEITYKAISDSCSLVRLSGWLKAVIPYLRLSRPGGRLARRSPLFMMFTNDAMACHPLLLNQTCQGTWRDQNSIEDWNRREDIYSYVTHLHIVLAGEASEDIWKSVKELIERAILQNKYF